MYLEVPIKLENYVTSIKQQTQYIKNDCHCLTLLQVGKANKDEHVKLMYLLYNPYPATIKVDLNLFNDINNLYKMYPGEFNISPNTCYAFVVYAHNDCVLSINESNLVNYLKRCIDHRLIKLNNIDFSGKYKNSLIYTIDDPKIDIDQTVLLNHTQSLMEPQVQEFIPFDVKYLSDMQMELESLTGVGDSYQFIFKFTNISSNNFIVNRIRIKLFDANKKFYVNIKEQVKFKQHSSKTINVFIPVSELHDVDVSKLDIKISLT